MVAGMVFGTPMDSAFSFGTAPAELRERFYEARELVTRAWKAHEPFSFNGNRTLANPITLAGATGGTFDVTVGPLVALWRQARKTAVLPDPAEIERARRRGHWIEFGVGTAIVPVFHSRHDPGKAAASIHYGPRSDGGRHASSRQH